VRAAVYDRYGGPDVLRVEEIPRPEPQDDELLVRVHATTVTQTDCHMRRAKPFPWRFKLGLRRPKRRILGSEFAGEVEAVGTAVTDFEPGDRVFGVHPGTHAEYICVRQSARVLRMPAGMSFENAAAVADSFYQGIGAMRAVKAAPGMRLLVYGASGSCGTACVQLARHFGAHVTAVCNGKNVELVRSLGADEVLDYERQDYSRTGQTYDVVIDAANRTSYRRGRRVLRKGGLYLPTDLGYLWQNPLLVLWSKWFGDRKVIFTAIPRFTRDDLLLLRELLEAGAFRAVVDRTYPLEDVAHANRYVDSWQKTGNVVLTLNGGPSR
jgi:NADPH:quinone reductase-like Zn-dependent oxidoreductase